MNISISNEEEWNSVGVLSSGDTVSLTADITFTSASVNALSIPTGVVFDGQSHTITTASGRTTGLFGLLGGTIRNVIVDGNGNTLSSSQGLLLISNTHQYGTISNCKALNATLGQNGGGIVGINFGNTSEDQSLIEYCTTSVTLVTRSGGITGTFLKNTLVRDCLIACPNVTSGPFVGGLCAFNSGDVDVEGCYVSTSFSGGGTVGGLFGTTLGGTITISKCIIAGDIGNGAGGFFGRTETGSAATITISDSYVSGDITGTNAFGAATVINDLNSPSSVSVERLYQSGSITGSFHGGIAVSNDGTLVVNSVYLGTAKLNHYGSSPSATDVNDAADIVGVVPSGWDSEVWNTGSTYPLLSSFEDNGVWDGYNDFDSNITLRSTPSPSPEESNETQSPASSTTRINVEGIQLGSSKRMAPAKGTKWTSMKMPIRWDPDNLVVRVRSKNK